RQEHVDAAARAEVEDRLALAQLRNGDRISATERCEQRGVGESLASGRFVELEPEPTRGVATAGVATAARLVRASRRPAACRGDLGVRSGLVLRGGADGRDGGPRIAIAHALLDL